MANSGKLRILRLDKKGPGEGQSCEFDPGATTNSQIVQVDTRTLAMAGAMPLSPYITVSGLQARVCRAHCWSGPGLVTQLR